jgi:hypothetical protein
MVHDTGKNFASTEFRQLANSMAIEIKEVPVEAHNSVGQVERYHAPLRRAYEIIQNELKDGQINKEMMLQMAVKAINDSTGPDGIVPTLLDFGRASVGFAVYRIDPNRTENPYGSDLILKTVIRTAYGSNF